MNYYANARNKFSSREWLSNCFHHNHDRSPHATLGSFAWLEPIWEKLFQIGFNKMKFHIRVYLVFFRGLTIVYLHIYSVTQYFIVRARHQPHTAKPFLPPSAQYTQLKTVHPLIPCSHNLFSQLESYVVASVVGWKTVCPRTEALARRNDNENKVFSGVHTHTHWHWHCGCLAYCPTHAN